MLVFIVNCRLGNTWVFAGALKAGDKLVGYDGDEVEDYHTYLVSEGSVIVRNKCNLLGIKKVSKVIPDIIPDKGFNSFNKLKKYLGSPDEGKAWHHIVEQSQIGKRAGNNLGNIISTELKKILTDLEFRTSTRSLN